MWGPGSTLNALLGAYCESLRLCALVMTVWAMLMVEIVNPTVKDMQEKRLGREKTIENLKLRHTFSIVFLYRPVITVG